MSNAYVFDIFMALSHYDSLAVPSRARRSAGPAVDLKRVHNDFKRTLLSEHASNASFLVDIGCGRGGDLQKWVASGVKRVLGVDVSEAQVGEAEKRRVAMGAPAAGYAFEVTDPDLGALDDVPDGCADVVTCMFAHNYGFETEETASRLVTGIARSLRPGGKFVGVCADGRDVATLLRSASTVDAETYAAFTLESLSGTVIGDGFGAGYSLRIADTVLDGEDESGPVEYAVHHADLSRLSRNSGLSPIAGSWRKPAFDRVKDPGFRRVSMLYTSFAFTKSLVADDDTSYGAF